MFARKKKQKIKRKLFFLAFVCATVSLPLLPETSEALEMVNILRDLKTAFSPFRIQCGESNRGFGQQRKISNVVVCRPSGSGWTDNRRCSSSERQMQMILRLKFQFFNLVGNERVSGRPQTTWKTTTRRCAHRKKFPIPEWNRGHKLISPSIYHFVLAWPIRSTFSN